jgi:hypothetical protein
MTCDSLHTLLLHAACRVEAAWYGWIIMLSSISCQRVMPLLLCGKVVTVSHGKHQRECGCTMHMQPAAGPYLALLQEVPRLCKPILVARGDAWCPAME